MSHSSASAQANADRPALPINPQPVAAIDAPASLREVQYECSRGFLSALAELNATLLVTTYQAGKLVMIGSHDGELNLAFHNFDRPMGTAVGQDALAIGTKEQIWLLKSARHCSSDRSARHVSGLLLGPLLPFLRGHSVP